MDGTSFLLGCIVGAIFALGLIGGFITKLEEKKKKEKDLQDWKDFEVSSMEERNDDRRK